MKNARLAVISFRIAAALETLVILLTADGSSHSLTTIFLVLWHLVPYVLLDWLFRVLPGVRNETVWRCGLAGTQLVLLTVALFAFLRVLSWFWPKGPAGRSRTFAEKQPQS